MAAHVRFAPKADNDGSAATISLRLVLRRMRQRAFVIEQLCKVAAIDPATACVALIKMLGSSPSSARPVKAAYRASHTSEGA